MGRVIVALVALLFAAIIATSAYIAFEAYTFLKVPPETPGQDVYFTVEPGEIFLKVAEKLHAAGLIRNVQYFRLLARWEKKLEAIQAGEFKLNTGWTPQAVLDMLVSGKPILYRLGIREGLTWWETAKIVEAAGFASFKDFSQAVRDKELLLRHKVPFDSAEGFLYPETYLLKRPTGNDARMIVDLLLKTFWEQAGKTLPPGIADRPQELRELIILASLVEKESAVPSERPRIAGVYSERLKKRMLLQCDPTIIYGLGEAFEGNLTRAHINDASNRYNTYQHPGMPPGPICSPSLSAIGAAVHPEPHDYLYFVSRGDGSHAFSKTLDEHNRAVRKYQLGR